MDRTLAIIKPDGVKQKKIGAIIKIIEENDFKIKNIKKIQLSPELAQEFYSIHRQKPFFRDLVSYMTSGEIVALELEKEKAIDNFRVLIGATDPKDAVVNTIRKLYGTNKEKNVIHGSDSVESALKEINFFFKN